MSDRATTGRAIVVLAMTAAVAVPIAAENGAWFGTPIPPGLSDPRKPIMKYDDAFGPLPAQFAHRPGTFASTATRPG